MHSTLRMHSRPSWKWFVLNSDQLFCFPHAALQSNGESLFVLNTTLAQAMHNLITGRENALANLQKRQAEEMAAAVANNVRPSLFPVAQPSS